MMGFILWVRPATLLESFSGAFMKSHSEDNLPNESKWLSAYIITRQEFAI